MEKKKSGSKRVLKLKLKLVFINKSCLFGLNLFDISCLINGRASLDSIIII